MRTGRVGVGAGRRVGTGGGGDPATRHAPRRGSGGGNWRGRRPGGQREEEEVGGAAMGCGLRWMGEGPAWIRERGGGGGVLGRRPPTPRGPPVLPPWRLGRRGGGYGRAPPPRRWWLVWRGRGEGLGGAVTTAGPPDGRRGGAAGKRVPRVPNRDSRWGLPHPQYVQQGWNRYTGGVPSFQYFR